MKKDLLIICGGKSEEHEISLISAKCVLDALDRTKFNPSVIGISRSGVWHWQDEKTFYKGEFRADKIKLNTDTPTVTVAPFSSAEGRGTVLVEGQKHHFDVVFPILHGQFGEDGTLQGMFDILAVPYVGSHCGSSWICMDKALTKMICEVEGIKTVDYALLRGADELPRITKKIESFGYPVFVKPCRQGSSVGVSKVNKLSELEPAVKAAFKHDSKVLVEKGISGREIECAVLGLNRKAKVSLPGEIIPSKSIGWYSYEAKYLLKDGAETKVPAELSEADIARVQEFALKVFDVLECDGMARVDLFMEHKTGDLYLNEANSIPGFTPISMYPQMWQASGLPYPALITQLIELAFQRLKK